MKIKSISLNKFKRFENLQISNIPATVKLVVLTGPNGSGKSSLFEGFNFWSRHRRGKGGFDQSYHSRDASGNINTAQQGTNIEFHDFTPTNHRENRRSFYIRSAYRHEADFTSSGINNIQDILDSPNNLSTMMQQESRISENYNRIVGEVVNEIFVEQDPNKTAKEIKDRLIGQIRTSMATLFGNLILSGTGNPTNGGTFRFNKGAVSDFHFKNLSGGEKAAFDLLLDFIVKKETFNNTIFCIDEPELHMHTKLQGKLLEQLFVLLPDNCQLWISTHSIGMARKAAELDRANPGQVAFIDFHNQDFDQTVKLDPTSSPTREFWKNMFETALDDLSQLVVPAKVIFCEGRRLGSSGRNPAFDVKVYTTIFSAKYPDTDFIPLGGTNEVQTDGKLSGALLRKLAPSIKTWMVFDRDDRSEEEIQDLKSNNIKVLAKRDLESYLWSDEILTKLANSREKSPQAQIIINKKNELLSTNSLTGKPNDDIKVVSGQLYNFCKTTLSLIQCGNDAESFARDTLAPLITPDTETYKELEAIILKDER
ncbi:MAG: ATP-binding protein [Proteobacteria bacterium]|nr:ATP-binding protein [Pseudomonadota bacterium]